MNGLETLIDIWKEGEKITLSDVNATQKDMFSFSWISWLQIFRCEHILWSKYKKGESTNGQLSGQEVEEQ